jgi:hypothetical protein
MRTALREFSATCEAIVGRPLAVELFYNIVSGNPDVNIMNFVNALLRTASELIRYPTYRVWKISWTPLAAEFDKDGID